MGNAPPTSTLRPPNVIHVIGVPRPSPFYALFRFRVLYYIGAGTGPAGLAMAGPRFIFLGPVLT